ncbi:hypothetical protein ABGT15_04795 [Flavobacterium enshiense]|uniref:hypothetical protein n=1 Tax=Flavobacterium enshiense TaxID=1341165 RepID=UPI00345D7403
MPLNKAGLESAIKAVLTAEKAKTSGSSIDSLASGLANAIDTFVKTGLVSVNVTTTGSASAQAGTGTGTIS